MESPKIIYVQAHGGGSEQLDNKFISLNQYRTSIGETKIMETRPYILRIVSPGKSALSDFESDRANVNFLYDMLTNDDRRQQLLSYPNTRHLAGAYSSDMEGSRGFGELLTSTSLYTPHNTIFNEIVEVELHKRSGDIHSGEGQAEDPGGFGIFIHDGEDWKFNKYLSSILIDSQKNARNITILEIVNFIINKEGPNVVVIFPNCSPFGDVSYTSATERNMWSRIKTAKNTYQRQINLQSQFKLLLEIITRTKNFFDGQKRFSEFLQTPPQELSGSQSKAKSSEKNSADRIGVIEEDDLIGIYQLFLYFFKDYHDWLQIHQSLRFPELLYILNLETYPDNINIVKFAMCLVLLIFKNKEKHGGIMYENKKDRKGREHVWKQILRQSSYGPRGRENANRIEGTVQRDGYRSGELLKSATKEQTKLLEFVESIYNIMQTSEPGTPRYLNYDLLVQNAINFATEQHGASKSGGRRKKTQRQKKRKLHRKRKTRKKKGGSSCRMYNNNCNDCVAPRPRGSAFTCVYNKRTNRCSKRTPAKLLSLSWSTKCDVPVVSPENIIPVVTPLRSFSDGGTPYVQGLREGSKEVPQPSVVDAGISLEEQKRIEINNARRREKLQIRNGIVNSNSSFEGSPCFTPCEHKGWCEAGVKGSCDWENYCYPSNNTGDARISNIEKQYCDKPLRQMNNFRQTLQDRDGRIVMDELADPADFERMLSGGKKSKKKLKRKLKRKSKKKSKKKLKKIF